MINEKNIISFGKFQAVYIKDEKNKYFLPNFHYLTIKEKGPSNKNGYLSICLELGITYWSENDKDMHHLVDISIKFLEKLLDKKANNNKLLSIIKENHNEDLWTIYRTLSMKHTLDGKSHPENQISQIVTQLVSENTKLKNENQILEFELQQLKKHLIKSQKIKKMETVQTDNVFPYAIENVKVN